MSNKIQPDTTVFQLIGGYPGRPAEEEPEEGPFEAHTVVVLMAIAAAAAFFFGVAVNIVPH